MRAKEFYNNKPLNVISLANDETVIEYMIARNLMLRTYEGMCYSDYINYRRMSTTVFRLVEGRGDLVSIQQEFLQKFKSFDEYDLIHIKVGVSVCILNTEMSGDQFDIWGFIDPKTITKIFYTDDEDRIMRIEFNHNEDDTWPRVENAEYKGHLISHSIFLRSKKNAQDALTMLLLQKPSEINTVLHISGI